MGFEPLVNQRLLPPTFPRYTVIRSRDDALIHIEGLLYRLQIVTTVPELTTFHIIMVRNFIQFLVSLGLLEFCNK